jgi:hypothetical protein
LIDGIAASLSISKLFLVKTLGDVRMPFAGYWLDHRSRIELATINAHRAAEASSDVERRLNDRVAREARHDGLEIRDLPGGLQRIIPFASYWSAVIRKMDHYGRRNDPACICRAG